MLDIDIYSLRSLGSQLLFTVAVAEKIRGGNRKIRRGTIQTKPPERGGGACAAQEKRSIDAETAGAEPGDASVEGRDGQMEATYCRRCGAKCKIDPLPQSNAKMLKRSRNKGLCVNCAVHDWLRNTYPVNILLAQSGPKALQFEHIRQQFLGIMKTAKSDAEFGEIDWDLIIENWDLPFPNKVRPSSANPCNQLELDEIKSGKRRGPDGLAGRNTVMGIAERGPITSFEQLNELEPGFGDILRDNLK